MCTAVLLFSDFHYGKKTKSYNTSIARDRLMGTVADQLGEALKMQKPKSLQVFMLGDIVDGSGIYPSQPHHQEKTSTVAQFTEATEVIADFLLEEKKRWKNISVEAVPGNHGRVSRFVHDTDNWDTVLYEQLRVTLKGRIKVQYDTPINKVADTHLLYHGHGIPISNGTPLTGISTRTTNFATSSLAPFKNVYMGHFHSFAYWQHSGKNIFLSGTTVTDDMYIREKGLEGANYWWLLGFDESQTKLLWQLPIRTV